MLNKRKIWRVAQPNVAIQRIYAQELGISEIAAQIMWNRGICCVDEAREFLYADLNSLGNPFLLIDMDIAVKRIRKAIECGENILIYGDYDVDGITSTSVLIDTFGYLGVQVDYYIPNRLEEGYGLNKGALLHAQQKGINLIITVDCGISAIEEAQFAKELGLDLIITDHHEVPELIPTAVAVINPKRTDCPYPFKHLAGVGVAFKLAQALLSTLKGNEVSKGLMHKLLDIVALGTIADIVSLKGENRLIVKYGLEVLTQSERSGIIALIDVCGLTGKTISTGQVGFGLAPRLNAAGRMGDAKLGVKLLTTKDYPEAYKIAKQLDDENKHRQEIEAEILEAALKYIEKNIDLQKDKVLVISGPNWHSGVIGIVASRIVERYHMPTIILTFDAGGEGRGSARSVSGFDMYQALENCSQYLSKFGGHHQAAGLSINIKDLKDFVKAINEYGDENITPEMLIPSINLDGIIPFEKINENIVQELNNLAPFGMDNPGPILANHNVSVVESRGVGNEGAHLKLRLRSNNLLLDGIGFNLGELAESVVPKENVDVAFSLDINEWNGRRSVQLLVKDLKFSEADYSTLKLSEQQVDIKETDNNYTNLGEQNQEVKNFINELFAHSEDFLVDDFYRNIGEKEEFYTKVVGVTFEGRQELIKDLKEGEILKLVREPDNIYDTNAIKVVESKERQLGYLNKSLAKHFSKFLDNGETYEVIVTGITGGKEKNLGVNILIRRIDETNRQDWLDQMSKKRHELSELSSNQLIDNIRNALLKGNEYREKQWEAIQEILSGKNVFTIFGTGRGKSAIFQSVAAYKALKEKKITVIVYPLRALVNDQFEAMKNKLEDLGLRVYKGNGSLATDERVELVQALQSGEIDILLTTPEFIEYHISKFTELKDRIGFFVVDESHHISLASKVHRPVYKRLKKLIKALGNPLTLGVTATANDQVAEEVMDILGSEKIIIDPHIRENLDLIDKRDVGNKNQYIRKLLASEEKTIIYVNSRNKTIEIASYLRQVLPSMQDRILFYNAGLNNEQRVMVEKLFRNGDIQVVVTTSAFGEGIDIPDVKHVILYHLNFNFTEFNQQSGRAGRDGSQAEIHILCGQRDSAINEFILDSQAPDREMLRRIYGLLLKLGGKNKAISLSNSEICEELVKDGVKAVKENTISASLGILEELNLLQREKEGRSRKILLLPSPQRKLDLEQSLRFCEGLQEKEEFRRFCSFVFSSEANELLEVINRPIYPNSFQQNDNINDNTNTNQVNSQGEAS